MGRSGAPSLLPSHDLDTEQEEATMDVHVLVIFGFTFGFKHHCFEIASLRKRKSQPCGDGMGEIRLIVSHDLDTKQKRRQA